MVSGLHHIERWRQKRIRVRKLSTAYLPTLASEETGWGLGVGGDADKEGVVGKTSLMHQRRRQEMR